jgi:SpoVK/Ycf46/Vps4 family AAA+-type ATPase
MSNETSGARMAADVGALLRARNALLWVVSPEEGRVERALIEAAAAAKYEVRMWDCVNGVTDATGKEFEPGRQGSDPAACLAAIRDSKARAVWIMRDLPAWLKDPTVCRATRSLARALPSSPRDEARAIIILSPTADIPPELSDHAIVVKWSLPDRAEIATIFDNVLAGLPTEVAANAAPEGVRELAIEAAVGLSAEAAASTYAKSLVTQDRKIVPSVVAAEKKRVINASQGVEWFEPDPRGLAAVGGLDNLKNWLTARSQAFSQRARDFGLPTPKGVLCVGLPGTGKSLMAKAIAAAWQVPLLKLDLGAAKSKWVGESEANLRKSLAIAEAVGRCVCWLDEVDKSLSGAANGAADGGVSSDALGTLLSWMQERRGQVFVLATANDVRGLPPELLRKGRFDEVFWVGLPTQRERAEIIGVAMRQHGRDASTIDVNKIVAVTDGFVGSEITSLVPAALFQAFAGGERALTTDDLLIEAKATVPLSKTSAKKVDELREWAKSSARPASLPETEAATGGNRNLDL